MADDSKRRRGRRRGRGQRHAQSQRPEDKTQEEQVDSAEEAEEPEPEPEAEAEDSSGSGGRRFGLPFGRGGDNSEDDDDTDADDDEREPVRERQARSPGAAPMDFWRRGKARPYREAADRQREMGLWQRISGFHFPAWVPVVGIIVLVFGILGLLFVTRSAVGAPRVADHWHATYEYIVCGQRQPHFREWRAGVHTHEDGIIHMHPFSPNEEGAGARLVKWIGYGGGKLDGDEVRAPGSRTTYKNGDLCDDGQEGVVQVFVNGQKVDKYTRYIPQDGDSVQIIFGPEQGEAAASGGISIPESEVKRTIEIEITDAGNPRADSAFSLTNIDLTTGEAVRLVMTNTGTVSHGFESAGADDDFEAKDDNFGSQPATIGAGEQATAIVRFNDPGTFRFQDTTFSDAATGTFTVTGDPVQPITVTVTENEAGETEFLPSRIEVVAGKTVNLVLKNAGELTHGITIAGDDGEFRTDDDIATSPEVISPGEEGTVSFILNELGEVPFIDVQDVVGTLIVVEELADPDASPTPFSDEDIPVDVELEVTATLEGFEPAELTVGAGESFRITITNGDEYLQNLRVAGPDGNYRTDDDLISGEVANVDDTAVLVGTIDDPGTYEFRDDFHTNLTGTITIE